MLGKMTLFLSLILHEVTYLGASDIHLEEDLLEFFFEIIGSKFRSNIEIMMTRSLSLKLFSFHLFLKISYKLDK